MSRTSDPKDVLRKAAVLIDRLERRVEAAELSRTEPIAIVGAACRLPGGVRDLDSFWNILERGLDAVSRIPSERFDIDAHYDPDPLALGKTYTRDAALIEHPEQFDAAFFGISPREAVWLDPQHRLLVECAWEALEHAGIPAESIRQTRVGVYLGIGPSDYGHQLALSGDALEGYFATGTGMSFSAGRIAYLLGLQGPAMAVDTACSSSLVSLHLACRALRAGECELALAGGVQLMLSSMPFVLLSRLRALAPDGRCKSFSDRADGYGRGEGCGMIALKRLSVAERDGDRILALIKGTAINHDGASSGLTTPNGIAQTAVIRQALNDAGLDPADVDYVEAHGTGTSLGDPIEVEALANAYGRGRAEPLRLGTVKANIGHLESAAGIAGVLKVVASLQRQAIPPSLHAEHLTPHVNWQSVPIRLVTQLEAWRQRERPRRAGVSSFGMSGTNAHVVIQEAPLAEPQPEVRKERAAELIVLSAKTEQALNAAAGRLRRHIESHSEFSLSDVAHNLATTRSLMERRLVIAAPTMLALKDALQSAERGEASTLGVRAEASSSRGKLAWLFSGQGAQSLGMGQQLYSEWTAFQAAFDEVCAFVDPLLEKPLRDVMWAAPGTPNSALLNQTAYTQPALFAFEWSLAALWRSWGIEPDLVAGHSIGEITAATVAGVFSLADAANLVCARGRLMQALPAGGAMVSLSAPEQQVIEAIREHTGVALAAINGPDSLVIAGTELAVAEIVEHFATQGVRVKRLSVSHAFHSPLMDPMLEPFRKVAEGIVYNAPKIGIVSNTTGALDPSAITTPHYWVRHVRDPVRFAEGVRALAEAGAQGFIEIGPKPTLLPLVTACLSESTQSPLLLPSLQPPRPEALAILHALAAWLAQGGNVTWKGVFPAGGRRIPLPTYPWQRQRYWAEPARLPPATGTSGEWPLSGSRQWQPTRARHHIIRVGTRLQPYLRQHMVYDRIVVPGAFHVSAMLAVAAELWPNAGLHLEDIVFSNALALEVDKELELHVVLSPEVTGASCSVEVTTRVTDSLSWTMHASARVSRLPIETAREPWREYQLGPLHQIDPATVVEKVARGKVKWGTGYSCISAAEVGERGVVTELTPNVMSASRVAPLHPVLLDNALGSIALFEGGGTERTSATVPFVIGSLKWFRATPSVLHCISVPSGDVPSNSLPDAIDIRLSGPGDAAIAVIEGFSVREAPEEVFLRALEGRKNDDHLYQVIWSASQPSQAALAPLQGRYLFVERTATSTGAELAKYLEERGATVARCDLAGGIRELGSDALLSVVVCIWEHQGDDEGRDAQDLCASALRIVRAAAARPNPPALRWITRRAAAVLPNESITPSTTALWGFGRSVMQEHPELSLRLVDVDAETAVSTLARHLIAADEEAETAWRTNQRYVARLVNVAALAGAGAEGSNLRTDGTALVTGGLGALGLEVARSLIRQGFRQLVLMGRRGLDAPQAAHAVSELAGLGATIDVEAVDVSDRDALAQALSRISPRYPLRVVVHAAAIIDDGVISEQTPERLNAVMSAKVLGAWNLHELTRHSDLDRFILFSSLAGTLGASGQASYAAANAFLDGLASHRVALGLPGMSLAWGPWKDRGLASRDPRAQARFRRLGIDMLDPVHAIASFEMAASRHEANLAIASLDLRVLAETLSSPLPPIWQRLVRQAPAAEAVSLAVSPRDLLSLPPEERMGALVEIVRLEVARVMSLKDPEAIALDRSLKELGLDSLMMLELRTALAHRTGVPFPASLAVEAPTISEIASNIVERTMMAQSPGRTGGKTGRTRSIAVCEPLRALQAPRARLFCFPDAGGAAAMYLPFADHFEARQIEVHAVAHARLRVPTRGDAQQFLQGATEYIQQRSDRPFVLFGHSMGALVARRVAQELEGGGKQPALCIVSCPPLKVAAERDSERAFELVFRKESGSLKALMVDFASDLELWYALPGVPDSKRLQVPMLAIVGRDDHLVDQAQLADWERHTERGFSMMTVPGDHFYLHHNGTRQVVLEKLDELLQHIV